MTRSGSAHRRSVSASWLLRWRRQRAVAQLSQGRTHDRVAVLLAHLMLERAASMPLPPESRWRQWPQDPAALLDARVDPLQEPRIAVLALDRFPALGQVWELITVLIGPALGDPRMLDFGVFTAPLPAGPGGHFDQVDL